MYCNRHFYTNQTPPDSTCFGSIVLTLALGVVLSFQKLATLLVVSVQGLLKTITIGFPLRGQFRGFPSQPTGLAGRTAGPLDPIRALFAG